MNKSNKPVSIGQSHNVISILANNVDWGALDGNVIQEQVIDNPQEAGEQFTAFLKNGGRVVVGQSKIITIDRSTPFDVGFINCGFKIDEEDERSLALTEIDLDSISLETMRGEGEDRIHGEEKLMRLKKAKRIRLDAKIFLKLWENKHLIPKHWKEKIEGNTKCIYFDGTIFLDLEKSRCALYLHWDSDVCMWQWGCVWIGIDWFIHSPSAVL